MKKLSLLLALLMVVCCFALASCGEEETTSTPATESQATEDASSAADESTPADESAPADESTPATEESTPADESVTETPEGPSVGETSMFWISHFNDGFVEGSGVIFPTTDAAGGWWLHVAFKPVEVEGLENVYEIVEITNGLADGSAATVAVPEGGFVWAANTGNNYPAINPDGSGIDYTSPHCSDAINAATLWMVGDKLQITGLDLEGMTIPTTTEGVNWYDDAYVCTATWAYVVE